MMNLGRAALAAASVLALAGCGVTDRIGEVADRLGIACDGSHVASDAPAGLRAAAAQDSAEREPWSPPSTPLGPGEPFTLGDWTLTVVEIDYDATDEVLADLAERGHDLDRTWLDGRQWVVADVEVTNEGAEAASPEDHMEAGYINWRGTPTWDVPCVMTNEVEAVGPGQTVSWRFGTPVRPHWVEDGYWGIGLGDDPAREDMVYVR